MELIAEGVEIVSVPAIAQPKHFSDGDRVVGMLTTGEPLEPFEYAEGVRRLLGYGWDRAKVAARLGVSTQTIANHEENLAMPEPVKAAVREGAVSITNARAIVRESGDEAPARLAEARETAHRSGRSRVTARSLNPKAPTALVRRRSEDTINILVSQLAEIAESGDGERDRRNARLCLERLGLTNNLAEVE